MDNLRIRAQKLGGFMLSIGWSAVFILSIAGVGSGGAVLGLWQTIQSSLNESPITVLFLLLRYGLVSVLAIVILAGLLKATCWVIGKLLVWASNYYPAWCYRPQRQFWLEIEHNRDVILYIKGSRRNGSLHLRLQFSRIVKVGATLEEQSHLDLQATSIDDKRLYDRDLEPTGLHRGAIATKKDGKLLLLFPNYPHGFLLDPGEYVYEFDEWGIHRGQSFAGYPRRMKMTLDRNGVIGV